MSLRRGGVSGPTMNPTAALETARAAVLALPAPQRAQIADEIDLSLKADAEPAGEPLSTLWREEIQRRVEAIANGKAEWVDLQTALRRVGG